MPESFVQVSEGTGKKLHSVTTVIGSDTVHDEVVKLGEQHLASYSVNFPGVTTATGGQVNAQLMAGAILNLYIRRIYIAQRALGAAAATQLFKGVRLTAAGTGGTAITPRPFDTTDAAAGATAQMEMSVQPTIGFIVMAERPLPTLAAQPMGTTVLEWVPSSKQKAIRIPAGTVNGIGIQHTNTQATVTWSMTIEFDEANF